MLSPTASKLIVLVALFTATFVCSLIPVKITSIARHARRQRRRTLKSALSLMGCFAAGVFLGTCLLDLFPDVDYKLRMTLSKKNIFTAFPMGEFLLAFGFFLILIVEQVVLTFKSADESEERRALFSESDSLTSSIDYSRQSSFNPSPVNSLTVTPPGATNYGSASLQQCADDDFLEPEEIQEEIADQEAEKQPYKDPSSHSRIRSAILLLALSLHSVFEGLAVGLQPDTAGVLQVFLALALHKSILAFSLGMNLVQSKLSIKAILLSNFGFSVASPFGIGLGIAVMKFTTSSFESDLVDGILQGIACGTFIYVVFFEILPHEFNSSKRYPNRMLKVLFLILGFGVVTTIVFLHPDNDLADINQGCKTAGKNV